MVGMTISHPILISAKYDTDAAADLFIRAAPLVTTLALGTHQDIHAPTVVYPYPLPMSGGCQSRLRARRRAGPFPCSLLRSVNIHASKTGNGQLRLSPPYPARNNNKIRTRLAQTDTRPLTHTRTHSHSHSRGSTALGPSTFISRRTEEATEKGSHDSTHQSPFHPHDNNVHVAKNNHNSFFILHRPPP